MTPTTNMARITVSIVPTTNEAMGPVRRDISQRAAHFSVLMHDSAANAEPGLPRAQEKTRRGYSGLQRFYAASLLTSASASAGSANTSEYLYSRLMSSKRNTSDVESQTVTGNGHLGMTVRCHPTLRTPPNSCGAPTAHCQSRGSAQAICASGRGQGNPLREAAVPHIVAAGSLQFAGPIATAGLGAGVNSKRQQLHDNLS